MWKYTCLYDIWKYTYVADDVERCPTHVRYSKIQTTTSDLPIDNDYDDNDDNDNVVVDNIEYDIIFKTVYNDNIKGQSIWLNSSNTLIFLLFILSLAH